MVVNTIVISNTRCAVAKTKSKLTEGQLKQREEDLARPRGYTIHLAPHGEQTTLGGQPEDEDPYHCTQIDRLRYNHSGLIAK